MNEAIADNLAAVRNRIDKAARRFDRDGRSVTLIAVTKAFGADAIAPALEAGHRDFGENRVQEATAKWPPLKARYKDVRLHLIGLLQSNKVREAVRLFDVIHTVDREKIAAALATEMALQGKRQPVFVQVNIGSEAQKAGVTLGEAATFIRHCRDDIGLQVEGLMCIPPADEAPGPYFARLAMLAREAGVAGLSMGMSGDFETAIWMGATHVRVGSAIFGERAAAALDEAR